MACDANVLEQTEWLIYSHCKVTALICLSDETDYIHERHIVHQIDISSMQVELLITRLRYL